MPPVAAGIEFLDAPLAVFGLLLLAGALVAGLARRSLLSLTALFVVAGLILGQGGLEVLDVDPGSDFVQGLAVIALILILFRDGLEVEAEMLQKAWHLPFRKLVLAMPLTAVLVAVATHELTDLGWTESFLVGALLSPTDPVLSSTVVTNPRVPRVIRHSLNLESGLNDGLALPAVLAFTAAAEDRDGFVWWEFVLQDVGAGLVTGLVVAFLASRLMPRKTAWVTRSARIRRPCTRSGSPSPPTASPCCRPRATASSRCSCARSPSASGARTSGTASRPARRT